MTTWQLVQTEKKQKQQKGGVGAPGAASAGAHHACDDAAGSPAVLGLGVGDGAVLLAEVQPELTLVSEVEVTFFTLWQEKKKKKSRNRLVTSY